MPNITARKVVGIDEVGRGCGSGPLIACAFIFREDCDVMLRDSKELSAEQRTSILNQLKQHKASGLVEWALVSVKPEIIDRDGIQRSNTQALRGAASRLIQKIGIDDVDIIADGNFNLSPIPAGDGFIKIQSVIKADRDYPEVSAASIIAKVTRDLQMDRLHEEHPHYEWNKNKGYLTRSHENAIQKYGITSYHRRSFCTNIINKPKDLL